MANDRDLLDQIGTLVEEEERLLEQRSGHTLDPSGHARLQEVESRLDQCWDLLRQRRAREEFGLNPDEVQARSVDVVENYEQ
jgi:Protein of unknown function (DUF2630)